MKSFEEEYLNIISKENEIIEEGRFVNSLLAGAALFSAASLCPPKISEKTVMYLIKLSWQLLHRQRQC